MSRVRAPPTLPWTDLNRYHHGMLAAQIVAPHRTDSRETVIYVRPWGDNSRDGLSPGTGPGDPGTALSEDGGLQEADRRVPMTVHGERYAIDVTGCDITIPYNFALKTPVSADQAGLTPTPPDHPTFLVRAPYSVRAEPALVATLDASTSTSPEPTHGMLMVTDPTAAFAINEHVGRVLSGAGLFEWGVVSENDATTLTVAYSGTLTPPIQIWEPGATLTVGDPAEFFGTPGLRIAASCDLVLQGLRIRAPAAFSSALALRSPSGTAQLWWCDVEGVQFEGGLDAVVETSHFGGKSFSQNGQSLDVKRTVFRNTVIASQDRGGSGNQFLFNVRVVGCTSWPLFGLPDVFGGNQIEASSVEDASGDAVIFTGGGRAAIGDVSIYGATGSGFAASGPGRSVLTRTTGTGNAGFGASAREGAHLRVTSTTTVTGTSGDLRVGSISPRTYAQLDAFGGNEVDGTELVRVYR